MNWSKEKKIRFVDMCHVNEMILNISGNQLYTYELNKLDIIMQWSDSKGGRRSQRPSGNMVENYRENFRQLYIFIIRA